MDYYILEDKIPKKIEFKDLWKYKNKACQIIWQTEIKIILITTLFFGWADNLNDEKPILFKTWISGINSDYQREYSIYEEAEIGHQRVCEMIKNKKNNES